MPTTIEDNLSFSEKFEKLKLIPNQHDVLATELMIPLGLLAKLFWYIKTIRKNKAVGCLLPFISMYMRQTGISPENTGIIDGVMPFIGFLSRPVFGIIADKSQRHKLVLVLSCILTGVFFVLLLLVPVDRLEYEVKTNRCKENNSVIRECFPANYSEISTCPLQLNEYLYITNMEMTRITKRGKTFECKATCKQTLLNEHIENDQCLLKGLNTSFCPNDIDTLEMLLYITNVTKFNKNDNESAVNCLQYKLNTEARSAMFDDAYCSEETDLECNLHCSATEEGRCLVEVTNANYITYWTFAILYLLGNIFYAPIMSTGEAISYDILKDKRFIWGKQRAWGSFGFAFFAFLSTFIMDLMSANKQRVDYSVSFYTFGAFMLITAFSVAMMPKSEEIDSFSIFKKMYKLLSYRDVNIFLGFVLVLGYLNGTILTFLFLYLQDELNNELQLIPGLSLLVNCAAETPALFASGYIIKRIGHVPCLCIAFAAYGVRFIGYSILTNVWQVLGVEVLHGFTFGLMWPTATSYASIIAPKGMSATMQGLISGIYWGLGRGLGSIITGQLYIPFGMVWTFRLYGLMAFALMFVLIGVNKLTGSRALHTGTKPVSNPPAGIPTVDEIVEKKMKG